MYVDQYHLHKYYEYLLFFSENGGIYLDTDVLVLKSFQPLMEYKFTMGRPSNISLANGIMLSVTNNPFLCVWLESYRTFDPNGWGQNSVEMAHKLSKILPELIHIEEDKKAMTLTDLELAGVDLAQIPQADQDKGGERY